MTGIVYDLENYPNFFSCCAVSLDRDDVFSWEISTRRSDAASFYSWLQYLAQNRTDMIGFNNLHYDYHLIHLFMSNPGLSTEQLLDAFYRKTQEIINSGDEWGPTIWDNQRFIPQIDLYKIHHMDNKAKRAGLKQIQCTMRSDSVEDIPVKPGTFLLPEQMDIILKYGEHDTLETKKFAILSKDQINFRRDLMNSATEPLRGDVMNFNDTKIGKEYLIQQLGEGVCYDRSSGRKKVRQTIRSEIPLKDVIFPYISFEHPEFQRVLGWMKEQTLRSEDLDVDEAGADSDKPSKVQTKGAFKDVHAVIDGFRFDFGTGGIHGSLERALVVADDQWRIGDVDVTSLYPSIAIVNRRYPQHLGEAFVDKYADVKKRRLTFAKKTPPNEMMKLGLNGVYGDSNNPYSCFLDAKYTMTITINGQLLLCMLAERLMTVPSLQLIQINTDGITFKVHRSMDWLVSKICKEWEKATWLDLESVDYSRMWIRDVNNYVAESAKDKKTKMKGAYLYPETVKDYAGWWHKDYSALVVQRAAHAAMVHGVPVKQFVHMHGDPFDFMLRAKIPRDSTLRIGEREVQRITRYYMAKNGGPLTKLSPPVEGSTPGQYKRGTKVSQLDYWTVMQQIGPNVWDARIHTKNKSKYDDRIMAFHVGFMVAECNRATDFNWSNVNYDWYINEAEKLIIR